MWKSSEDFFSKPKISFNFQYHELQVKIETQRLYICSYQDNDFENCVSLYGNKEITKYFDHGKARSRVEVENLISERGKTYFIKGQPFGLFSVFSKYSMNFMGQVDLVPTNELGTVEIGCILHKQYQDQNFGTESVIALAVHYVDELNFRNIKFNGKAICKVMGTVHPKNVPSNKILKKLGMTFDKYEERFGNPRLWYSYVPKSAYVENQKIAR
ncbi:MAG: GNAT family N-acetyltransferase [Chlamydiales bacterium]